MTFETELGVNGFPTVLVASAVSDSERPMHARRKTGYATADVCGPI